MTARFCAYCGVPLDTQDATRLEHPDLCIRHQRFDHIRPLHDPTTGRRIRERTRWEKMGTPKFCMLCGQRGAGITPAGHLACRRHRQTSGPVSFDWATGQRLGPEHDPRANRPDYCSICGTHDAGARPGDGARLCAEHWDLPGPLQARFDWVTGRRLHDTHDPERPRP
jgi:hypothetical protein